jgi:hypothetical protein
MHFMGFGIYGFDWLEVRDGIIDRGSRVPGTESLAQTD